MKSLVPYKFHEDIPANEKCYACKTPKLHFLPNFRGVGWGVRITGIYQCILYSANIVC